MRPKTLLLIVCFFVARFLVGQIGDNQQYVNDILNLDPEAVRQISQNGTQGGDNSRWAILAIKAKKHDVTVKEAKAKRKERDLQRQQLALLSDGLRRTKEVFLKYYERYQILSGAVQTVTEALRIGRRVRSILELLDQLRLQFVRMDQFSDPERDYVMEVLTSMAKRTERVLKRANFVLLGNNIPSEELDELREEHGNFMVLMRSIDRTEQLALIDREISRIVNDLRSLVNFLNYIQKNRKDANISEAEMLRDLLGGN